MNCLRYMLANVLAAFAVFAIPASAQIRSSGLQCVADQLASCKLTNRQVKADSLMQYQRAFSCIKNGSTSGTTFDLGVPLPDGGMLGFGLDSSAKYSTEICREEVKKLESASFLKQYSEVFDQECGKTLAGQYDQCLKAKVSLESVTNPPQSLTCNAVQSNRNLVLNLRYTPALGEAAGQYTVKEIVGVSGIACETGVLAGTYYPTSLNCTLPTDYERGQAIVRLVNGISCQVPILPERKAELDAARKYSCSGIYNRTSGFLQEFPLLARATIAGLCDACVNLNVNTPDTDQRTLANRFGGCAVWALKAFAESEAQFCTLTATSTPSSYNPPGLGYGPSSYPGGPLISRPGTDVKSGFVHMRKSVAPSDIQKMQTESFKLCADRSPGEVLGLNGATAGQIPIDFLSSAEGNNPMFQELIKVIEEIK